MMWIGAFAWAVCAVVTAIIAGSRDRNPIAWLGIGAVIGIFGLILVIALPAVRPAPSSSLHHPLIGAGRKHDASVRDCPDCREAISISASKCEHCGFRLA